MSLVPQDDSEVVVQRITLEAANHKDSRTAWSRFVDAIRQSIGLKPVFLAERWAVAKVRQEEVEADAKLLAARAQYELAVAKARQIQLQADGQHAKDLAIAQMIAALTNEGEDTSIVTELLQAGNQSVEDALANVEAVAQQIRLLGGNVEVTVNDEDAESDAT